MKLSRFINPQDDLLSPSADVVAKVLLIKEVIQPQVLLQLPCYDFTPIINHTVNSCLPCGLAHWFQVQPTFVM